MKTILFLVTLSMVLLFSCTNEEVFDKNDRHGILELKEKYGLNRIEKSDIDLSDLQATPIDSLVKFLEGFEKLKGVKIPITMKSEQSNNLQLAIDTDRFNIPHIKTRSETVLISEMLLVSLATLRMNVWLDCSVPSVTDSKLTGLTVFDRWEQTAADASKNDHTISFTVHGIWYYKIFVDGIGDFFSYAASFSGSYNKRTREGDLRVL